MIHPTRPGQPCRIIDSFHGKQGITVGKAVTTRWAHPVPLRMDRVTEAGVPYVEEVGIVWRVEGKELTSHYGSTGNQCDVPAAWLEVLPEAPVAPAARVTETETHE